VKELVTLHQAPRYSAKIPKGFNVISAGLQPGGRKGPNPKIPEAAGFEKGKDYIEGMGDDFWKEIRQWSKKQVDSKKVDSMQSAVY